MNIVAGMILLCNMEFTTPTRGFLKDVETKVWYVKPDGDAFIEYNLRNHKNFDAFSTIDKLYDISDIDDMKRKDRMNCRERN